MRRSHRTYSSFWTMALPTYAKGDKIFASEKGNDQGSQGLASVPSGQEDITIESAEECPGECIFLEP